MHKMLGWAKAVERSQTLSDYEKNKLWKELEDDMGKHQTKSLRCQAQRILRQEATL